MKSIDTSVSTTFHMDIGEDEIVAAAVTLAADTEGVMEKVVTMTDEQFAAWCAKEERDERELLGEGAEYDVESTEIPSARAARSLYGACEQGPPLLACKIAREAEDEHAFREFLEWSNGDFESVADYLEYVCESRVVLAGT